MGTTGYRAVAIRQDGLACALPRRQHPRSKNCDKALVTMALSLLVEVTLIIPRTNSITGGHGAAAVDGLSISEARHRTWRFLGRA